MFEQIKKCFEGFPAQWKVAKLLLERGFQVREDGKVVSGRIEVALSQIAREAEVGRRAVVNSINRILSTPKLKKIYLNLRQVCLLIDVAPELNLSVLILVPKDPQKSGILARIASEISGENINILQAFAEHPITSEEPGLIMILDGNFPSELVDRLQRIPDIRSITIR